MKYDNEKLNEVILVLWNDIKGELIPEHEKLTKFAYAVNAWTNNQDQTDSEFEIINLPLEYKEFIIELNENNIYNAKGFKYSARNKDETEVRYLYAGTIT